MMKRLSIALVIVLGIVVFGYMVYLLHDIMVNDDCKTTLGCDD